MAVLQTIKGLTPPAVFTLGDQTVVGRHPDCDIVLELGAISRQHAKIVRVGDEFFVEDLHSRNGTLLNDRRVEGRARLAENDRLKLCDVLFVFHADQAAPAGDTATLLSLDAVQLVDDEKAERSSVTSKLDVSSGTAGLRIQVNAETRLKALLEIGRNLGGAVRLEEVLPKLLDNLFAIFVQADRGFILLRDAAGRMVPRALRQRPGRPESPMRISRTVIQDVVRTKEAILSADAAADSRFGSSDSIVDIQIHSMLCAPLIGSDGGVLGAIQIDTRDRRRRFTPEDLEVLASVACQAATVVENAQLHDVAMQEELLQRELALAHKVQRGLLPAMPPRLEGYEFFDFYEPAKHLGGDYFDYIPLPGGRLASALADVSGKGIAASLLVARLSAEVRYSLATLPQPADAMAQLNQAFCESRWEDRFVTMVLAVLDPAAHRISFVNAGHLPPLLRRAGGLVEPVGQDAGGLPLGVDADSRYQQFSIHLEPGDCLVLYTDGVPDALNAAGQFYGGQRLRQQLAATDLDAALLGRRLTDDVRRFIGPSPQSDDICLTCIRRTK